MKRVLLCVLSVLLLTACSTEKSMFKKAQILEDKGEFEKAIQAYSAIIKKNPENYAALASRGLLFERLPAKDLQTARKNKELAERDYLRAVGLNYFRPELLNNLGALYLDQGRYEEAIFYLNQALAHRPQYFMALLNRAMAYSQKGDMTHALIDFSRAEELDDQNPLLYLNRGLAQYASGYYTAAVSDYTAMSALDPENPRAYLERGRAFIKMDYFQDALDDFHQAIALRPDYALPYYFSAELLFSKGDTEQGIAYAEHAKKLAPNYAPVYEMLGDMLALETPVEATQHYLAARRLNPSAAQRYQAKIRMLNTENGRKKLVADRFLNIGKR